MALRKLDNVEIFRTGKWHGKPFTESDLDGIVSNFEQFKDSWFRPAVKKGHSDEPGALSWGYISKLWRAGKTLVANLIELPEAVYNAIKAHGYDQVSIELAPALMRDGKKYKNVLLALGLLGVEIPEVDGLKPLRDSLSFDKETEVVDLITVLNIEGDTFAIWTEGFINTLPDAAFAVIEKGKPGTRHLPHHTEKATDSKDNDTVDKPHLANALYKLAQIDIDDESKALATEHLETHAKALGINIPTTQEVNMTDEEKKAIEAKEKEQADKILKLAADLTKAQEEIKKLTAKDDKDKPDPDAAKTIETLKAEADKASKEILELQATNRKTRIDAKLEKLRVPAMRPFIEEFYNLAATKTDVIKFSVDGKDPIDTTAEQVVDQLVEKLNAASESIFINHSTDQTLERDDVPPDENIRDEVDRKVKKHMVDNKMKPEEYDAAQAAVFTADPEMKAAYAKS